MKRLKLTVISMVLATGFCMQGCSSNKDHGLDPDQPITIHLWNYYNGTQKVSFDKLVEEFNQTEGKEKGILVEVSSKGSIGNIQAALSDSLDKKVNAEELPDIFSTYADTAQEMNEADMLVSIKDYMNESELDAYVASYLDEGRIYADEDIKIFPIAKASEVLVINKSDWDEFEKATGSTTKELATWEGLNQVAKKYYEYSGKAFFGRDALMNYLNTGSTQLKSSMFKIDTETKKATFTPDKAVFKKLWDNYYIPYVSGYYTKIGKFASDDFKTNDIIASVSSSAGATFFPKEIALTGNQSKEIDYLVMPIPNFEGCEPYAVSQGAGMAIVKSKEQQEYASIVFLKWLSAPQQNIAFTAASSYLPVTKEANNPDIWKAETKKEAIKLNDIVTDCIQVSMQQVNESTLTTQANFNNSYQVRNKLEASFLNIAATDQKAVQEAIEAGANREEVLSRYTSEAYFETWFTAMQEDINQLLQEA